MAEILKLLWFWTLASITSGSGDFSTESEVPPKTAHSVKLLSIAEVLDAFEIGQQGTADLEAVVVYVNAAGSLLRVQDYRARILTCGVGSLETESIQKLKLGDRLQFSSTLNSQKRIVQLESFEVVGHSEPIVKVLQWQNGKPHAAYGRYVEATGIVQEICLKGTYLNFIMTSDENTLMVRMPSGEANPNYESWLGKEVRVQGPMAKNFVSESTFFGHRIDLLEASQMELLDVTPSGTTQEQIAKGKEIQTFEGLVDGSDPSQCVFVNGIRIPSKHAFLAECGRKAKGYVIRDEKDPKKLPLVFLQLAELIQLPIPEPIDASKALSQVPMQTRGTVEGIVVGWHRDSFWSECFAESNGTNFRAVVPTYQDKRLETATNPFHVGSRVQFTGVLCKPNLSKFTNEAYVVRVESPREITLVKDSAGVAREQFVRWLNVGGGILAFVSLWVFLLRRQVASRTKTIEQMSSLLNSASEAIRDGMILFSSDQRFTSCNAHAKRFLGEIPRSPSPQADIAQVLKKKEHHHTPSASFTRRSASI